MNVKISILPFSAVGKHWVRGSLVQWQRKNNISCLIVSAKVLELTLYAAFQVVKFASVYEIRGLWFLKSHKNIKTVQSI